MLEQIKTNNTFLCHFSKQFYWWIWATLWEFIFRNSCVALKRAVWNSCAARQSAPGLPLPLPLRTVDKAQSYLSSLQGRHDLVLCAWGQQNNQHILWNSQLHSYCSCLFSWFLSPWLLKLNFYVEVYRNNGKNAICSAIYTHKLLPLSTLSSQISHWDSTTYMVF